MINLAIYILLGINLLVCILLTLLVLMQKPRSEGLGAAFGGNFTDSIFGAQTSDVLTKGTIWLGGIFMALTLVLGVLYSHRQADSSSLKDELCFFWTCDVAVSNHWYCDATFNCSNRFVFSLTMIEIGLGATMNGQHRNARFFCNLGDIDCIFMFK